MTLDPNSSTYKAYTKPGNVIQYVNRESKHPPSVLQSVPQAINKRPSNISSDKQSFDSAVPPYQEALGKAGTTASSTTIYNHLNEQKSEAEISHGTTNHLIQTFPQMWDKEFSK